MRGLALRGLGVGLATLVWSGAASATPGISGYSGKPYNGVADTCTTNCHAKGNAGPTLDITVPTALKAGDKADVTLVVNGTRKNTAFNAAFTDGVVATKGQGTDVPFPDTVPSEVVSPTPAGKVGTFKFSFTAPNKNGPITLYVAAMSTDGAATTGDGLAVTTRKIEISGATEMPAGTDGGASSGASASSASSTSSTSSSGASTTPAGSTKKDGGSSSSNEDAPSHRVQSSSGDDGGGCDVAPGDGPPSSALATLLALVIASVCARHRRR